MLCLKRIVLGNQKRTMQLCGQYIGWINSSWCCFIFRRHKWTVPRPINRWQNISDHARESVALLEANFCDLKQRNSRSVMPFVFGRFSVLDRDLLQYVGHWISGSVKMLRCLINHHAMKMHGGNSGIVPCILNLANSVKSAVIFTSLPFYVRGKNPGYHFDGCIPEPIWMLWRRAKHLLPFEMESSLWTY